VRAFVATDDPACLLNKPLWEIPYPDAGVLVELLRDPILLKIMPATCRPPLKLEKDEKSDASLVLNGCLPRTPEQEFIPVWGNCSNGVAVTGHFVSKPLTTTLPKLIVPVCCGTDRDGIHLRFVEQQTGRTIELHPETSGRWHSLIVTAPQNPFRLEITSPNPHSWVAVGEIKELGRLSYYTLLLLKHAVAVLLAGLGLCVLLAGFAVVRCGIGLGDGGFVELVVLLMGLGG
jgi:hypothetical protein